SLNSLPDLLTFNLTILTFQPDIYIDPIFTLTHYKGSSSIWAKKKNAENQMISAFFCVLPLC
ncbi:MAG: hypothetical protein K2H96_01975, partial [Muribaculaceae bacterium]|nr:hypothetical protein [Muribaculaceae bacterium]